MKRQHTMNDRRDDLYETHPIATNAFIKHHKDHIPEKVWECAAGRGAISRILKDNGYSVVATDLNQHDGADDYIESSIDFLMEYSSRADMIITNPPYKLANAFIRHALSLDCRFAGLMPLAYLSGANRFDILRHCTHCYVGIERLPMMHREGWAGPKIDSSAIPFAWFVFDVNYRSDTIPIKRISWRETQSNL
jgi:hypothetical protein